MRTEQLLFGANVLCAVVCAGLATANWWYSRRWSLVLIASGMMVLAAGSAGTMWRLWGACLLPHRGLIPYHDGMTLCPGQATDIVVPSPLPAEDRRL